MAWEIHDFVRWGSTEGLAAAIQSGLSVNGKDRNGYSALRLSVSIRDMRKVNLLLAAGADPNARDADGNGPLCAAVANGDEEILLRLVEYGARIDCQCDCGTLIAVAVLRSSYDMISRLVSMGVDPNAHNADGFTPLMLAAGNRRDPAIPILVAAGAEVDRRDRNGGLTAYLHAAIGGNNEAGGLLLEAGADPTLVGLEGDSAASLAREHGREWYHP